MTLKLRPGTVADRVVIKAATTITRRKFLRNTGATALGVALGAAYFTRVEPAWAIDCYGNHGPCGPSPLCPFGVCSSAGKCNVYWRRVHDTFTCDRSGTVSNCWAEHCECGATWAGTWNCCDCCGAQGGGSTCTGGCGTACICRTVVGPC